MQLASLVRGDAGHVQAGRDAAVQRRRQRQQRSLADRDRRRRNGARARRLSRHAPFHAPAAPRRRSRRIDVWLAPSLGWLPVRIVQTEPNGMQIELLWRGKLASTTGPADGNGAAAASAARADIQPSQAPRIGNYARAALRRSIRPGRHHQALTSLHEQVFADRRNFRDDADSHDCCNVRVAAAYDSNRATRRRERTLPLRSLRSPTCR